MENYAVFESIGENWEQVSVWLEKSKAIDFLARERARREASCFYLMMRIDT